MTLKQFTDWAVWTMFNFSIVGSIVLEFCNYYVEPPGNYPHLWPLMISVFSAVHFTIFLACFNFLQFRKEFQDYSVSEEKKKK